MSEVKTSVEIASKMLELFKIDDARLHAVFQEVDKEYEAFNVKSLEIENRIMKYNQRLHSTQQFSQTYQRLVLGNRLFSKNLKFSRGPQLSGY